MLLKTISSILLIFTVENSDDKWVNTSLSSLNENDPIRKYSIIQYDKYNSTVKVLGPENIGPENIKVEYMIFVQVMSIIR